MTKKSFNLRNVVAVAICLVGITVVFGLIFSGCKPDENDNNENNDNNPFLGVWGGELITHDHLGEYIRTEYHEIEFGKNEYDIITGYLWGTYNRNGNTADLLTNSKIGTVTVDDNSLEIIYYLYFTLEEYYVQEGSFTKISDYTGNIDSDNNIQDESAAGELAKACRAMLDDINNQINDGFSSTMSITGNSGSVKVEGTKIKTSIGPDSQGSGYDETKTHITINFSDFSTMNNLKIISGKGSYDRVYTYDYAYWGATSSTKLSVNYTLSSCRYSFTYQGVTYTGIMIITYIAPFPYAQSYSGTVSIRRGGNFAFSGHN